MKGPDGIAVGSQAAAEADDWLDRPCPIRRVDEGQVVASSMSSPVDGRRPSVRSAK